MTDNAPILSPDDEELLKFIEAAKPKIYIVGAGGSGSNTVARISEVNIDGVKSPISR